MQNAGKDKVHQMDEQQQPSLFCSVLKEIAHLSKSLHVTICCRKTPDRKEALMVHVLRRQNNHPSWKEAQCIRHLFAYFCFIFAFDKTPARYF